MLNLRRTLQLMSYSYRRPCEVSLVWTGPVSLMLYHFRCDASQSKAEIVVIHHKAHHQQVCSAPRTLAVSMRLLLSAVLRRPLGLSYVRVSPDMSSFLAFVRASGRVFENRRFVRVFGPIRKYIRTLPIAKAYDGMRQRKFVSFQYKMSITSQNAILVQASCTV